MQRALSTVVLLGLLVATASAFAITEHLKLIKSPIYAPHVTKVFSPACHCATDKAEISFALRRADSVTVTIVDSDGRVIDTIATDAPEPKGTVTFPWDGRNSAGAVAADQTYQPQVELANARRTILMPNQIVIDEEPPRVISASAGDGVLTPGSHHSIVIKYEFSEQAHAAVYLHGRRIILGRPRRLHAQVKWTGKVGGKTVPPGRYVLEVAAVDIAGNVAEPGQRKRVVVRIRAIALAQSQIHVGTGARFTVDVRTGASHYTWRFAGAHGTATKHLLHLRAPGHQGRYRLVVSEHGHSTTGLVIVGKP